MLPLSSLSFSLLFALGVVNAGVILRRDPAEQVNFSQDVTSPMTFRQDGLSIDAGQTGQNVQINASIAAGGPGLTGGPRELPSNWEINLSGVQFDFSKDWIAIYYQDFSWSTPLTVDCTPNDKGRCDHTFQFLLASPKIGDEIPSLDIQVPFEYHVLVKSQDHVSFTQPSQVSVQKAALLVPLSDIGKAVLVGFDKATITLAPFEETEQIKNMEAEIAMWAGLRVTNKQGTALTTFALAPTFPYIQLTIKSLDRGASDCRAAPNPGEPVFSNLISVTQKSEIDLVSIQDRQADGKLLGGTPVMTQPEQKGCFQLNGGKLVQPAIRDSNGNSTTKQPSSTSASFIGFSGVSTTTKGDQPGGNNNGGSDPNAASHLIVGSFPVVAMALFALFV